MKRYSRLTRSYTKPVPVQNRIPLVYNAKGYPFIWHNLEHDRIEIVHGAKTTVLQLVRNTVVTRTPWLKEYRSLIEFPILDIDGNTVASWIAGIQTMEFDLLVIRHSRQITCYALPKRTVFQVQHEATFRAA